MLLTISGYDPQKLSKTCASYLCIRVELSQLFGTLTPSLCDFYDLSALKRSDWWRDANSVSWWAAVKGLTLMCWLDCDNEPITGMIWIWGDDFIFNFSVVIVGPFFWHHHSNLRCRWEFNGCTLTRTNQFSQKNHATLLMCEDNKKNTVFVADCWASVRGIDALFMRASILKEFHKYMTVKRSIFNLSDFLICWF